MDNLQPHRPFNLEHAKAGAPIGISSKLPRSSSVIPARLVCSDFRGTLLLVIASSSAEKYRETVFTFNSDGTLGTELDWQSLVMLPLDYIEGTPIFTGDSYEVNVSGLRWDVQKAQPRWNRVSSCAYRLPVEKKKGPSKWMAEIKDTRDGSVSIMPGIFLSKEACVEHCNGVNKFLQPFVFVAAREFEVV